MVMGRELGQEGGDVSGVSDAWATGKADPVDPSAPAQKTRDLLQQAGVNIRDYIRVFARTFNELGNVFIQMYYQRNQKSFRYKRTRRGENDLKEIARSDMAAKVHYQTRALAFDADKLNAKREDVAIWQIIRGEPLFAQNEEAVYHALKMMVKGWNTRWKNSVDKILPPLEQFKQMRMRVAVGAVQVYMQQMMKQAQVTGQQPQIDPKELMKVIGQFLQEMATVPPKEEQERRAKEAQGVA
jgi:hypothetical protein